jgi:hypothetical protein
MDGYLVSTPPVPQGDTNQDLKNLTDYVQNEYNKIQAILDQVNNGDWTAFTSAPLRPRPGMIRYAANSVSTATWRPMGIGMPGTVVVYDGTRWATLVSSPTTDVIQLYYNWSFSGSGTRLTTNTAASMVIYSGGIEFWDAISGAAGSAITGLPIVFFRPAGIDFRRVLWVNSGNLLTTWNSAYGVIQIGYSASLFSEKASSGGSNSLNITMNGIWDGATWKYIEASTLTSNYYQFQGTHNFRCAPGGTAGSAITWTTPFVIDTNGITVPVNGLDNVRQASIGGVNIVGNTTVGYPSIGYNITSGNAGNTWRFGGADNASWIQFQGSQMNFFCSTSGPVAGAIIATKQTFTFDNAGNFTIPGTIVMNGGGTRTWHIRPASFYLQVFDATGNFAAVDFGYGSPAFTRTLTIHGSMQGENWNSKNNGLRIFNDSGGNYRTYIYSNGANNTIIDAVGDTEFNDVNPGRAGNIVLRTNNGSNNGTPTNTIDTFVAANDGICGFGVYTATPGTITGYITIRDRAGNTRKLAVTT